MSCRYCGAKGRRHTRKCTGRPRVSKIDRRDSRPRLETGKLVTVEICRDYYDKFAHLGLLNSTQRELFRFLLELAEMKQLEGAT